MLCTSSGCRPDLGSRNMSGYLIKKILFHFEKKTHYRTFDPPVEGCTGVVKCSNWFTINYTYVLLLFCIIDIFWRLMYPEMNLNLWEIINCDDLGTETDEFSWDSVWGLELRHTNSYDLNPGRMDEWKLRLWNLAY